MEKKFEEEVPRILKTLNYPFTISKSAMFAIGSLHTWPTLLGALHWMVELIRVSIRSVDTYQRQLYWTQWLQQKRLIVSFSFQTVNTIDIEQVLFPLTFQEEELQDKRHEKVSIKVLQHDEKHSNTNFQLTGLIKSFDIKVSFSQQLATF